MFCTKCGEKFQEEGLKFCQSCGTKTEAGLVDLGQLKSFYDSGMYSNIGEKIKTLAKVLAIIFSILCIIIGIVIIIIGAVMNSNAGRGNPGAGMIWLGIGYMFLGPLFSWIYSFFMYGFGELIVRTTETAINTAKKQ